MASHFSADLRAAFADLLFAGSIGFLLVAILCLPSKFEVLQVLLTINGP